MFREEVPRHPWMWGRMPWSHLPILPCCDPRPATSSKPGQVWQSPSTGGHSIFRANQQVDQAETSWSCVVRGGQENLKLRFLIRVYPPEKCVISFFPLGYSGLLMGLWWAILGNMMCIAGGEVGGSESPMYVKFWTETPPAQTLGEKMLWTTCWKAIKVTDG